MCGQREGRPLPTRFVVRVERLASYRRHSVWWFGFGAKGRTPLVYVLVCLVKSKLFIPLFSLKGEYLY